MEKRLIYGMSNIVRSGGLKWLLAVVFCFLFSCKQETAPEGILTRPQMVKMLIDVYITEEKATRLGLDRDSTVEVFDSLKVRLFTKIGLTDTVFRRSIAYYSERPKEM